MKIAATVILFVAAFFVADGIFSDVSVQETVQKDFLNVDSPAAATTQAVEKAPEVEEEVVEDWIETIRRRRTRRQSRFC